MQIFHAHVTWDTDCLIALSHYFPEKFILEKIAMRIPLLAYFLVMGIILFSGLVLVSSQLKLSRYQCRKGLAFHRRSKPRQMRMDHYQAPSILLLNN